MDKRIYVYDIEKCYTLGSSICLYTPEICEQLSPIANDINKLKKEKCNYFSTLLCGSRNYSLCYVDFVGDSYELSKKAKSTNADTIIFAAVKFMAETAKLLGKRSINSIIF